MRQRVSSLMSGLVVLLLSAGLATSAFAQAGRVGGTIKDEAGQPIKGATVTAENPQASPSTFTATTDDKGRFSMIGLKAGNWTFTVQAPGYAPAQGYAPIKTLGVNAPLEMKLAKGAAGPLAGALAGVDTKALQADLQAAETAFNAQQYDQAITLYQGILTKAPALTVIHLQIGNAYRAKKDYDKALASYQEVLKGDPNNDRAIVSIGMTNLEKGDLVAAESTLTTAAQNPGASREVFYNLGEVKFAKGQTDEAAAQYQKAVEKDAAWAKPLFKLALVALNKGDKEGATMYLEKAIAAEPTSAEAIQAKTVLEQLKKS